MNAPIGAHAKILTRRAGPVGEIILNNPARHNAISLEMWERLTDALADAAADNAVRVLVISGAGGKAFASGADLSTYGAEGGDLDVVRRYGKLAGLTADALYNFPKPTMAKIHGACVGGGVNLAVCCDMRIAATDASFSIPAAKLGVGYALDGVKRLAEVVGLPVAMDLFFTARSVSAEEALRIGLVNRVVSSSDVDDVMAETARIVSENAPLTIAGIKAIARELGKPAGARDLDKLERFAEACYASRDFAEGRNAFLEKRKPEFNGT
jgi:enoyl-CoA hydratase/carnithine racemase